MPLLNTQILPSHSPPPSIACDDSHDAHQKPWYPPSRSASPDWTQSPTKSLVEYESHGADEEAYESAPHILPPPFISTTMRHAYEASRAGGASTCTSSSFVSSYKDAYDHPTRLSKIPKWSLDEVDDDDFVREYESTVEAGSSMPSHGHRRKEARADANDRCSTRLPWLPKRSLAEVDEDEFVEEYGSIAAASSSDRHRQKKARFDPDEQDYIDSADDSRKKYRPTLKGKGRASSSSSSSQANKGTPKLTRKNRRSDPICIFAPNCDCIRCEDCNLCFSRNTDFKRHRRCTPQHQTQVPEASASLESDPKRLWCKDCGLKFQRGDARLRHEKNKSCGRARWTKNAGAKISLPR
jgi:hypothetical protein